MTTSRLVRLVVVGSFLWASGPVLALACSCAQGIPNCMVCCPTDFTNAMLSGGSVEESLAQMKNAPPEFRAKFENLIKAAETMKANVGDTAFSGTRRQEQLIKEVSRAYAVDGALDELKVKTYLGQAAQHQGSDAGAKSVNDAAWDDLVQSGLTRPGMTVRGFDSEGKPMIDREPRPQAIPVLPQGIRYSQPGASAQAPAPSSANPGAAPRPVPPEVRAQGVAALQRVEEKRGNEELPKPQQVVTTVHRKKSAEPPPPPPPPPPPRPQVEEALMKRFESRVDEFKKWIQH